MTQTNPASFVNKFSRQKNLMLDKFANIQSKINLQIEHLSKSIKQLNSRKPERCIYGWKCKRKFCKFSHEYLYSYKKFTSSKCDEMFSTSEHLEEHQQNLHENILEISENLHHNSSETRKETKLTGGRRK